MEHILAHKLQYARQRHVLHRMKLIVERGSPVLTQVERPTKPGSQFLLRFKGYASLPDAVFAVVKVNSFADEFEHRWIIRVAEEIWPVSKSDLEVWLQRRLTLRLPTTIDAQAKLLMTL